jgi:DNA polymerase-3 subunit alpha
LAKDFDGYQNLIKITSIAHMEGYYYKPRIDKENLKKYSKGLIALSACVFGGEVPSRLSMVTMKEQRRQLNFTPKFRER